MEKKLKIISVAVGIGGLITIMLMLCIYAKHIWGNVKKTKEKIGLKLNHYSKKLLGE